MDFDEEDALLRTADDRDLLGQVIRFAVEDFPPLMNNIREAVDEGRSSDISKLAHKMKGSAGACGARTLYMAALDLELAGKDGENDLGRYLASIEEAFGAFATHPRVREIARLDDDADASIG